MNGFFRFNLEEQSWFQLLWKSLAMMLVSILVSGLTKSVLKSNEVFIALDHGTTPLFISLIMLVVLSPILEELTFRYPVDFKKRHILVGISSAFLLFGTQMNLLLKGDLHWVNWWGILAAIVVYPILQMFIKQEFLNKWTPYRLYFIYGLIFLFAIAHIQFELNAITILTLPLILLPQISLGIILTHLRLKFNLLIVILLHALMNGLVVWQLI